MQVTSHKPRLVFFQWRHDSLPKFLQLHMQMHVKCLSEYFDVVLINKSCDYQEVCELYQPDVALFESGYKSTVSKKIIIRNTKAHSRIPKLGLHNGDGWCDCRTGFLSDMDEWGIDTFFTISVTTAEHTPEISDNLYVWPNFIDSALFHDYGLAKSTPILINGNINSLYPWRQKIQKIVSSNFATRTLPHSGYEGQSAIMSYGEPYARIMNASWLVPTCGSVAKEIVRKHFEIPGSRACLITERTPALEAAGFSDMVNCVFADEYDILDKVHYLLSRPADLERIIDAGYQMVQSCHTLKQRDQLFQWFQLNKNLDCGQRIIQEGPFARLRTVEKESIHKNTPVISDGRHLMLLKRGDEKLQKGEYGQAEVFYLQCLKYIFWMCEPKLKLAICLLYKGAAGKATNWVIQLIQFNLNSYKAASSDPVEWAYYIICLLAQGNLKEATIRSRQFTAISHPELNRVRWVVDYLTFDDQVPFLDEQLNKPFFSVHQLPSTSFSEWLFNLCRILNACKQYAYVDRLKVYHSAEKQKEQGFTPKIRKLICTSRRYLLFLRMYGTQKLNVLFNTLHVPNRRKGLPSIFLEDYLIRLALWAGIGRIKMQWDKIKLK